MGASGKSFVGALAGGGITGGVLARGALAGGGTAYVGAAPGSRRRGSGFITVAPASAPPASVAAVSSEAPHRAQNRKLASVASAPHMAQNLVLIRFSLLVHGPDR